ncbi:RNA polymerase sigma factor [Nannocystis pusilla]|uniref:Sigma-70 family RNA polymerase sigma factor n=1 Tax=Nannocystis pusilla TaxID=889268 RepID=A0ABS7TLR0_9BACT|nr:sigma-70 family RNA polymerase sigma factor [Nannocystis pusilla]MBZ5709136.1 sigma-70 family RNA polymerase sigma factor [Nannocystis pusilla]
MPSDAELVDAWRAGDSDAGAELFERHYDAVARFFHNKVGAPAGNDLIQRTFLACLEGFARYRGEASFRTYLFSIAYNLLCKHFEAQRRSRIDLMTTSIHDLRSTPSEVLAARSEQRLVLAALRRLPIEYQALIELHYWEQMTAAEAALALAIPLGTAKTRLRRARQLLEEQLAALADSPALLTSTQTDLESWARELRDRLLPQARQQP